MDKILEQKPLVSIITPSKNSGRFIKECIESVLLQDYPSIQHVIQDGASTDNTLKIIKTYAAKYKDKIDWVSEQDSGAIVSDNYALKRCKGEIILFLGSDCILLPHACRLAVKNMNKYTDVAVFYGNEYIINEKNQIIKTFVPGRYSFTKLLCNELVLPGDAAFIRRSYFEKVGFYLEEASDYELWVRLGLKFPIKHFNSYVSKFRWHSNSRTLMPNLIGYFVKNKKDTLDKLFESSHTQKKLKKLKKRAYEGLYFWAASMQIDSGEKWNAFKYLADSLLVDPSEQKLYDHLSYWRQATQNRSGPLVSIVTPSYNSGQFIELCIQSVLAQDYPHIEHIIQDGVSTDSTRQILKKYQKPQYSGRIKIFIGKDQGQSDALNRAIQKTKGDIILVLNADDMLMPYAVSWGVENMQKYKDAGVIYGDTYIINEKNEIEKIYQAHEYDFEKLLCVELVPPTQATFIRRSALEAVGLWADSTLDTCPDYEMWLRLAQKFPMKHVFGVITKYRQHQNPQLDSKMPRRSSRFVAAKKKVMDRFFNDPKVPKKFKKLRKRAYRSLYLWASETAFEMKNPKEGVYFALKSFLTMPTVYGLIRIYQILRMLSYFSSLRLIKFLKTSI